MLAGRLIVILFMLAVIGLISSVALFIVTAAIGRC